MDSSLQTINMSDINLNYPVDTEFEDPDLTLTNTSTVNSVVVKEAGKKRKKASEEKTTVTGDRWVWTLEMVATLMQCLKEFKQTEEDDGTDFEGDIVRLYSEIRIAMSRVYEKDDFGPTMLIYKETDDMTKAELLRYKKEISVEEEQKKKGYQRIKRKVKELRQAYRVAVDTGRRSGSGKQVMQQLNIHWADLREIWGGSPAVTAIDGGISSFAPNKPSEAETSITSNEDPVDFQDEDNAGVTMKDDFLDPIPCPEVKRQKPDEDITLKDQRNKNKNMTKKLSTHQRDMLFYNLAQREQMQRRNQMAVLQNAIDQSNEAMKGMNTALTAIGNSISDGLRAVAAAFAPPPPPVLDQSFMLQQLQGPSQRV